MKVLFMENYVGKFVFVEAVKSEAGKESSSYNYNNGEWLVMRQSAFSIYCLRPKRGYDFQALNTLELIGDRRVNVVQVSTDNDRVKELAMENLAWSYNYLAPNSTEKKPWAEDVFYGVRDNAMAILRTIGAYVPKPIEIALPQKAAIEVELLIKVNGTLIKVGTLNERLA